MATASLPPHLLPPFKFSSIHAHSFARNPLHIPTFSHHESMKSKPLKIISLAFTESSDSSKSHYPVPQIILNELADCFVLPEDFFRQLPRDLRLDLNDAAFDLSNGAVTDECGEELAEILLNISRAWELGEASTSANLVSKLPLLLDSLTSNNKSGLGKRLISASRRFRSMGQYGQGEVQTIAKVMNKTGKLLSASPVTAIANGEAKQETKVLKFGELQVELTPEKAYTGAVVGVIFGILSWQVSRGIQSIPESSLEYANDNALLLAKAKLKWVLMMSKRWPLQSLRGALLALFYSSTVLSALSTIGLVLLGRQLNLEGK